MRRLPPPTINSSEVYLACVNGTYNTTDAKAYIDASNSFETNATLYQNRAITHSLFKFTASKRGDDTQIAFGKFTKGNLTALYEKGLLKSPQGRNFYDKLRASIPSGKCPYCHFGHVETLDHFLPKAIYPAFSVTPENLIPACMRCNKGKGSGVVTHENEISHPYFEDPRIENETWLHAKIIQTNPTTSEFNAICPTDWPDDLAKRVSNYFRDFDLAKRYSIEAASELVSASAYLADLTSPTLRIEHLKRVAKQEQQLSPNGWKTALYRALADSEWYANPKLIGTGCT